MRRLVPVVLHKGNSAMGMAVQAANGREAGSGLRPTTHQKGGVTMIKQQIHHDHPKGGGFAALLSPAALRIELVGLVTVTLIAGRLLPDFGRLLRQFSELLFR